MIFDIIQRAACAIEPLAPHITHYVMQFVLHAEPVTCGVTKLVWFCQQIPWG